jgi:hypothetical protein
MTTFHAAFTSPRRAGLFDSLVHRVGAALVAWSERPHVLDPRVSRLVELDELREDARARLRF